MTAVPFMNMPPPVNTMTSSQTPHEVADILVEEIIATDKRRECNAVDSINSTQGNTKLPQRPPS